jgi:beta-N-acetylhexosaminidase
MNKIFLALVGLGLSLSSCAQETITERKPQTLIDPAAPQKKKSEYKLDDFYENNPKLTKAVDELYNNMTVDERAAQMIMPSIGSKGYGMSIEEALKLFNAKKVAGFLFLKAEPQYFMTAKQQLAAASVNQLTKPVISCDGEAALIHYKFKGSGKMKPAAEQKTVQDVVNSSIALVKRIQPFGIQINFAPVVDNNVNKAIIGNRSFGANSAEIAYKAMAFINTHQSKGEVAVVKHFPGHGAVSGDSHKGLVSIKGELTEIGTFDSVFKANPIGVMVGHIAVQNNAKWGTNGEPATLSKKITTDLLKKEMKFKGIVFTDALNMGAVSKLPDASFRAAKAGADVLLMPMDCVNLHTKIRDELKNKGPNSAQFTESIKKILRLKICLGLA